MNRRQLIDEMDVLEASLSARSTQLALARRRGQARIAAVPPLCWPALGLVAGYVAGRSDTGQAVRYARTGLGIFSLLQSVFGAEVLAL